MISYSRRGQVAIFVIVALVVVAGILIYFFARGRIGGERISPELVPVYDYYQSCIQNELDSAIRISGAQGGRIYVGDYIPGSDYAPFSSHLNFLGTPIPYWFYVSANGLIKEGIPTRSEMERDIERFIYEGLEFCNMEVFFARGFVIEGNEPVVKVTIRDDRVTAEVDSELRVSKGEESAVKYSHVAEAVSKLGKFYKLASEIYSKQKEEAFLEKYAVDVLYLYAPVDGVEIQCAPKIWSTRAVHEDLRVAFEENFAEIKFRGGYVELSDEKKEYFVLDKNVDEIVRVMYSRNWPTKIEITGEGIDDELMIAQTIGTQEGMGVLGFCYAPYHFVYDVSFPALVQIYDTAEVFQFPVAVIIDNNVARNAVLNEGFGQQESFDFCQYRNSELEVNLFDINLNRVNGNLSYECFDQRCRLGQTSSGKFIGSAPKCVNGFIHVRAEGYSDKTQLFSTSDQSYTDIILDREFEVKVDVDLGGREIGNAIISFVKDDGRSVSAVIPEYDTIKLSEGSYKVTMYVYGNSSLTIPASTNYQCVDVPKSGLLGFFGATTEKCFDVSIPETKMEYALIGGGTVEDYFLESELRRGRVNIQATPFPTPNNIEQLQDNFELFDTRRIYLTFHDN